MTYNQTHPYVITLKSQDPHLHHLFELVPEVTVQYADNDFHFLVFSIIGQQLSTKVVTILYQRLEDHLKEILPETISNASFDALRALGLSKQKITYIKNLATYFMTSRSYFNTLSSNEKTQALLSIKGIGPWTVDMYKMFVLREDNHFSYGDLGLIRALEHVYQKPIKTPEDIKKATKRWSPYQSIVCHFLWKYWDEVHKGKIKD